MYKPKVLWCSQSCDIHTGYGVIANDILTRLHATGKYDVLHQAWYDAPAPNPRYPFESINGVKYPFKVLTTGAGGNEPTDMRHGQKNIKQLIETYQPDITIMFADTYMLHWIHQVPELDRTHLAIYYPTDGLPVPPEWIATLKKAKTAITYNKFGEPAVKQIFGDNGHMIYHGIDYPFWSQPVPQAQIDAKKMEMFGDKDVFVWGMVARNNPRKNIPAFFETFARHVQTHKKARILMHACNIDFGWNLERLAVEFGIKDYVYMTPGITPAKGVDRETLRLLYNTMNVHVNTAWGEGFGIGIWEAAACGVPNIVTNYSVGPEFITAHNAGELINVGLYAVEAQTHIRRAYINERHLLEIMNRLYEDRKPIRTYGRNAKTAASLFDWPRIIPQWETVIDKIMNEKTSYPINSEVII